MMVLSCGIKPKQLILLFFPILTVIWGLILNHISGPHFLSRTDPEYVYLLNGMNVALMEFDRIGHVDHPGTPFQLISGIFIRIIFWISGEGSLFEDVVSQPEKYLFWSSFFLNTITAYLIYWVSSLVYKNKGGIFSALLIPSSLFLFTVIIDLPNRYIPDRLLLIVILLFAGLYIKYRFTVIHTRKFAIWAGIIMALGITTKINFIPFIILPFFLITPRKGKLQYSISLIVATALFILPINHKLDTFWNFAVNLTTHGGLYGSGGKQVFNPATLWDNLVYIVFDNPFFVVLFFVAILFLILQLVRKDFPKTNKSDIYFLLGFLVVAIMSIVMVTKHYKNYYMIPILSVSGLVAYVLWNLVKGSKFSNLFRYLLIFVEVLVFAHAMTIIIPGYGQRIWQKQKDLRAGYFIQKHVTSEDYLLIEPTWMAGPMIENGLVYGFSYLNHRFLFYNAYEAVFPNNVLTYEGISQPYKYMRLLEAGDEWILKSGKNVFLLSSPGRNGEFLISDLYEKSNALGIKLKTETVYTDELKGYHILKISNQDGWKVKQEFQCAFEQARDDYLLTDDGLKRLEGPFFQTDEAAASGEHSIWLDSQFDKSPAYVLSSVKQGDFIQASIKRYRGKEIPKGKLVIQYTDAETGDDVFKDVNTNYLIHSDWELVRIDFKVDHKPKENRIRCFYKHVGNQQLFDDFEIKHCSKLGDEESANSFSTN